MDHQTNDFVQFEIVKKSTAPKKFDASINGLIYHNQFILNMREVPDSEKVEIIPDKP